MEQIYQQLIKGIQEYFAKTGLSHVVIGISGGIDSALTLKLAVDALGPEKVTALSMPELGVSAQINIEHAYKLCEALEVTFFSQPINPFLIDFARLPWKPSKLAQQNTKARIRAVLLYNYANTTEALVLGTSNKSEILLGYGTKYGDLAADLEVIGDLLKEEVFALADFVGLPKEIIEKAPTAELFSGQTDEVELGAKYSELDPILKKIDLEKANFSEEDLIQKGMNPLLVHSVIRRVKANKHKSEMPPIIKIGKGETQKFEEVPENQTSLL
ncbi:MAG: NAD+ synthase [Candidatus Gracilibacteria bacterium]|jgi:NAD+ synthase